jgi:hypothetical protein
MPSTKLFERFIRPINILARSSASSTRDRISFVVSSLISLFGCCHEADFNRSVLIVVAEFVLFSSILFSVEISVRSVFNDDEENNDITLFRFVR